MENVSGIEFQIAEDKPDEVPRWAYDSCALFLSRWTSFRERVLHPRIKG